MLVWVGAIAVPPLLTVLLNGAGGRQRDYIFLYLAAVAVIGLLGGLWPALVSAVLSFLLVDYFFVPPVGTLTIGDEQDIVNLLAFIATAGLVGLLVSYRRRALLQSEALTRQLREANAELVRSNRDQAAASQAALRLARSEQQIRALQESDRVRRELLANVSHELRTPLATILAESTDSVGSAGEAGRRLKTVATEARRLEILVDDMLDMARIEGGVLELRLEPVLLADAIAAAADRLHLQSPGRSIDWNRDSVTVEVLADWDRLGQILDNLLGNADRFSPADAAIRIEVGDGEPGLVSVRVIDRGPGVEPEVRQHVFERYVRGQAGKAGTQEAGTGLGLAIVKGLVEAHAGTVSLEPPGEEGGATFRFTLPRAPAPS